MAKESAEEKLLRMMQKKGAPVAGAKPSVAAASPKSSQPFSFQLTITSLNQALFVGVVVCAAILVVQMQQGMALINQHPQFNNGGKAADGVADVALPSVRNLAPYIQKIETRNIFKPYEPPEAKAAAQTLAKRMAKFKLVGVAWLDLPETASAMIEDTEKKTTYFLKQGERLEGVAVKTIYTDRVVLSDENEETTIKL